MIVLVDPYYVFGTPDIPGINVVRPRYENHLPAAKPYQVRRIKPDAVILGSSRAEAGLDPRHPGWAGKNVFNFGLPGATSYEVMLAFLQAQASGPLKQAVVGLDFFGFNIFFPRDQEYLEARFSGDGVQAFADFLMPELAKRRPDGNSKPSPPTPLEAAGKEALPALPSEAVADAVCTDTDRESCARTGLPESPPTDWNEALYLRLYPDVAAEVQRGTFANGYHHYLAAGHAEGRQSGIPPRNWNDELYLRINPDVAAEVARGTFISGYHHYLAAGRVEGRQGGLPPRDWNDPQYLRIYPDVAVEVRRGTFINGYHHYLVAGRAEGRQTGTPPLHWNEAQYLQVNPDVAAEVRRGTFISGYHHYLVSGRAEGRQDGTPPHDWNEELYLRVNPDVKNEIARGTFVSGYHHYLAAGKTERREGGFAPPDWYEARYLQVNPDVTYKIRLGQYLNGYHHYLMAGRAEKRLGRFRPDGWNEAEYLARNSIARVRLALGEYRDGYAHYAAVGQEQKLLGGFPPADSTEARWQRWPRLVKAIFKTSELFRLIFSRTAVRDTYLTLRGQSEPASFDDHGTRVWDSHDDILRKLGGTGLVIRSTLQSFQWYLWLMPPRYMYCFNNPDSGMTSFDAFRFMIRQAHANGTDLRLFMTPTLPSVRHLFTALGLSERYEFWQKELVRINEEEAARAGRKPLPLWDFSDANAITREIVPASADLTPMHWYWEFSHYRLRTGDLILDRIFGYNSPERIMPADFGVRLTGENINAHLAHSRAGIVDWGVQNPEFATQISAATKGHNVQNRQAQAKCW
ncbi:MAG: hypothetical protein QOG17_1350 [Gammaproteobacteria bacterium]|nr:hypothetical protein [Gammaproteobacteria bacterium]